MIHTLEHIGGKDDAQVLVGHHAVHEEARADGAGYQGSTAAGEGQYQVGDALQHTTAGHHSSKAHGTQYQVDGVEHTRHASRGNQLAHLRMSHIYSGDVVHAAHHSHKLTVGIDFGGACYLCQDVGLEYQREDGSQQRTEE